MTGCSYFSHTTTQSTANMNSVEYWRGGGGGGGEVDGSNGVDAPIIGDCVDEYNWICVIGKMNCYPCLCCC